jgi:hypothetical protein
MIIQLPVTAAALEKNDDLGPGGKAEEKIIIEFVTCKSDVTKSLGPNKNQLLDIQSFE